MDNILSIKLETPGDVRWALAVRFKARRLVVNLTQEGLAERSGVSWGSLKRFERTGLIGLDALLKLALVLSCLEDFNRVCVENDARNLAAQSLDDLLAMPKTRRRGRIK